MDFIICLFIACVILLVGAEITLRFMGIKGAVPKYLKKIIKGIFRGLFRLIKLAARQIGKAFK